jgi:chemotaxis protein MotB
MTTKEMIGMADEQPHQEIIIVRRRVEGEEGHHGGAWKIAYADFVTAMMAFFMVLWILNSTNKDSQTIIARYFNPVKMEDFAKNKKGIREAQQAKDEKPGSDEGELDKAPPAGAEQGKMQQRGKDPDKDASAKSMMNEETLFQNPYAALDQIAGKAPAAQNQKAGGAAAEAGSVDAFRDPFRASGMEAEATPETPGAPPAPQGAQGAKDSQANGQAAKAEAGAGGKVDSAAAAAAEGKAAEEARAQAMQKDLARTLKGEGADGAPLLNVKATDEGLLISLTDNENFGMFEVGSSSPKSKLVHLMERIAQSLKDQPGRIVLRGYTDGRRFHGGASDNWRLSASRAQMALYMLTRGGLPEARVERVEGYADHNLKMPDKPEAAENRRIEILLRKAAP